MGTQQMVELVANFVHKHDHVTFVELDCLLSSYIQTRGDVAVSYGQENVIIWAGMSPEFASIIEECLQSEKLEIGYANVVTYMADGMALTFPASETHSQGRVQEAALAPGVSTPLRGESRSKSRGLKKGGKQLPCKV